MSLAILQKLQRQRAAALRAKEERKQKRGLEEKKSARVQARVESKAKAPAPSGGPEWTRAPVLILFGTQTGNAKEISEMVSTDLKERGCGFVRCLSMRDYMTEVSIEGLAKEAVVVVVVSTTGQGDPPTNAESFWRAIRQKRDPKWLAQVKYTVLGLGDTNYSNFCAMGKFFDSAFKRLGAKRFHDFGMADDATGIDEVVEPWRSGLIPALERTISANGVKAATNRPIGSKESAANPGEKPRLSVPSPSAPLLVLHAGEKKEASSAAERLRGLVSARGFTSVRVMSLKECAKKDRSLGVVAGSAVVMLFISTTGHGDVPTNGMRFLRCLRKAKPGSLDLSRTQIAILAFGNPSYENFCGVAKEMSRAFESFGARQNVHQLTCIEQGDAAGTTLWCERITADLSRAVAATASAGAAPSAALASASASTLAAPAPSAAPSSRPSVPRPKPRRRARGLKPCGIRIDLVSAGSPGAESTADAKQDPAARRIRGLTQRLQSHLVEQERRGVALDFPVVGHVKQGRFLTNASSGDRHVLHLEITFRSESESVSYFPGDSVGVHCPNDETEVEKLLKRLGCDGETALKSVTRLNDQGSGGPTKSKSAPLLPHVSRPSTLRDIFLYSIDITGPPKKSFLKMLAHYCKDASERDTLLRLASPAGRADYDKEILRARPPLTELLARFPSCDVPLAHLLETAPPLRPRYYSIASSPSSDPTNLHVAFTLVDYKVVRYDGETVRRRGLCTSWLYKEASRRGLIKGDYLSTPSATRGEPAAGELTLPIFIRRGGDFDYPSDISRPIVMVGPGTGVAPFRGFARYRRDQSHALQTCAACVGGWRGMDWQDEEDDSGDEFSAYRSAPPSTPQEPIGASDEVGRGTAAAGDGKREGGALGDAVLFTGCRNRSQDFLYGEELEGFKSDGTLSNLFIAASREQQTKVYVQDLLEREGKSVAQWVTRDNSYFYVCGGAKMARSVKNTLVRVLRRDGGMSEDEAKVYVDGMIKQKRYVQDVWG